MRNIKQCFFLLIIDYRPPNKASIIDLAPNRIDPAKYLRIKYSHSPRCRQKSNNISGLTKKTAGIE